MKKGPFIATLLILLAPLLGRYTWYIETKSLQTTSRKHL